MFKFILFLFILLFSQKPTPAEVFRGGYSSGENITFRVRESVEIKLYITDCFIDYENINFNSVEYKSLGFLKQDNYYSLKQKGYYIIKIIPKKELTLEMPLL